MRVCSSSPFLQSLYTVALQTCRSFATCPTVSSLSGSAIGTDTVSDAAWPSSKLAAKFWLKDAKPCDVWNARDPEFSLVTDSCKGVLTLG